MPFELVKALPESYIEDKERKIIMRKKASYGPKEALYILIKSGTQSEIKELALEALIALRDFYFNDAKTYPIKLNVN